MYHISVIDYLTEFNFQKKLESYYKVTLKNQKEELVSCVRPELYGKRFIKFMNKEVIINEEIEQQKDIKLDNEEIKQALFFKILTEFNDDYESNLEILQSMRSE